MQLTLASIHDALEIADRSDDIATVVAAKLSFFVIVEVLIRVGIAADSVHNLTLLGLLVEAHEIHSVISNEHNLSVRLKCREQSNNFFLLKPKHMFSSAYI